jgi:predicted RNA-binding protein (virulence factor B family)
VVGVFALTSHDIDQVIFPSRRFPRPRLGDEVRLRIEGGARFASGTPVGGAAAAAV